MQENEKLINAANAFNRRMLENSVKIMSGKFGGGFYVNYTFDRTNGFGYLKLMLEYPDGNVFAVPMCKNVGKPIETDEERNGVAKVTESPVRSHEVCWDPKKKLAKIIPPISGMSRHVVKSAFVQYERPDFPIPMGVIWERIAELWEKLPIVDWCGAFTYAEVYQALLEAGENKGEQYQSDDCVLLTREEIEPVAEEMGYDFAVIRNAFETRHLWKKDANALGYQYSKKIDGKVKRFYALKKISVLGSSGKINDEYALEYTERLPPKPPQPVQTPQVPVVR